MDESNTVACTLTDTAMGERRKRWHDLAGRAFVERAETDKGIRLVFRRDAGVEEELRELALLERECCAFADWTVSTADERAVLDVAAGSEEAVAAVHGMFRSLERP